MTHSTVSLEPANFGSLDAFIHTINITSLDAAGHETYDPDGELNVNLGDDYGVMVVGQETETDVFAWDHVQEVLQAKSMSDGADVANNTDVGEVRLLVVGV